MLLNMQWLMTMHLSVGLLQTKTRQDFGLGSCRLEISRSDQQRYGSLVLASPAQSLLFQHIRSGYIFYSSVQEFLNL